MRVRTKTILITMAGIICLVLIFTAVCSIILVDNFDNLENRNTVVLTGRAVDGIENDILELEASAMVYAYWNETYSFAQGKNTLYTTHAIPDSTFQNLGVNAILILDAEGQAIYKLAYERGYGELPLPRGFLDHMDPQGDLVSKIVATGGVSGLLMVDGSPYEVVALPILKNDQSGPSAGTFMMAKQLDPSTHSMASSEVDYPVTLYNYDLEGDIPGLGEEWDGEFVDQSTLARSLDEETVMGYAKLQDVYGEDAMILGIELPRDIYQNAQTAQDYLLLVLSLLGGTVALVTVWFVQVFVTSKLDRLDKDVRRIGKDNDPDDRIDPPGNDELGNLAVSINEMLDTIEASNRRLADSEKRYKAIVEDQTEMIFRVTPASEYTFANAAFLKFHGMGEEDLERTPFLAPTLEEQHGVVRRKVSRLSVGGPVIEYEQQTGEEGEEGWVQWTIRGIFDDDGTLTEMQWVGRDVTERIRLLERLNQTDKIESLGVLAGGIAHDFNNMLTSIMGTLSLVKKDALSGSDTHRRLAEGERSVLRATELTKQLLTFSKGGEPIKRAISIPDFVRDTAMFSVRGAEVVLDTDFQENMWAVEADEGQFLQVISNLVINARQAMPGGGRLTIKGRNVEISPENGLPLTPGSYVELKVADEGIGISKEKLSKIFDPYFTTKSTGTGLGLSIVHSIVARHGGHIEVDSELGMGATFIIFLPAVEGVKEQPPAAEDEVAPEAGRVLLMDDEEDILEVIGEILTEYGYEVIGAPSGEVALEEYARGMEERRPFDVVIVDLTVRGGMGGKELIVHLREMDPKVRAIVSSGYSNDPVMANYRDHGFMGVVQKPYAIGDMIATIQSLRSRGEEAMGMETPLGGDASVA